MIFNEQQFTIKRKVFEVAVVFFYTDSSYENAVHPFFYEQQFSKIKNLCLMNRWFSLQIPPMRSCRTEEEVSRWCPHLR